MNRETDNLPNVELAILDETGIIDFKDFVIPDLFDQISSLESFEDEMIIAVGAVADGAPAAAIVVQLLETDQIFIHSIIVAEEYRRQSIGTELVKAVLQIGEDYLDPNPGEDFSFNVFVHTEYALSGSALETFEAFLKKNGFADFSDHQSLYIFDSEQISKLGKPSAGAKSFAAIDGADPAELEDYFNGQGIYPELDLCFYNGTFEDPKCFLMVQNREDGVYTVTSACENEDAAPSDMEELFLAAVDGISRRADSYKLVLNCEMNAFPGLWSKYEPFCEIKSTHRDAGLYIVFE